MQKEESSALHNRQESEFRLLLEAQKAAMESDATKNDLVKLPATERVTAQKQYSDERKELSQRQAMERTAFLDCNRKKELPANIAGPPTKP